MALELQLLAAAVIIGLVHLLWAAAAAQPQRGLKWNVGPRDEPVVLTGMAGRLERAFANFRETFPLFAAAVLAVQLSDQHTALGEMGASLYFWARVAYVPVYAAGIPVVRTVLWTASILGIILLLGAVL